jgi:hypothetical protein|tara:strand:- start:806 stop:1135 length:330 start_codon:yes stop_codon:yes gene_type:complete
MAIAQATLSGTPTVLLTVPAGKQYAITTLMVCNFAAAGVPANNSQFDLHFVQNGAALSTLNQIVKDLPVPGGETFTFDSEKIILDAGDTVQLQAQAPFNLSVTVSYLEV